MENRNDDNSRMMPVKNTFVCINCGKIEFLIDGMMDFCDICGGRMDWAGSEVVKHVN